MRSRRRNLVLMAAVALLHVVALALLALTQATPVRVASGGPMSVSLAQGLTSAPFPGARTPAASRAALPPAEAEAAATVSPATLPVPASAAPVPEQHAPPTPPTAVAPSNLQPTPPEPNPAPVPREGPDFVARVAALAAAGSQLQSAPPAPGGAARAGAATLTPAPAAVCRLDTVLQATLGQDPAVLSALARIPRRARTVANAIMLWDGRWIDPQPLGGEAALSPIRESIRSGVKAASPACQQATVKGPLLIAVMTRPDTTILAIGSGEWRWADLLR